MRAGTLCVFDFKPRTFPAAHYTMLSHFAEILVRELERELVRPAQLLGTRSWAFPQGRRGEAGRKRGPEAGRVRPGATRHVRCSANHAPCRRCAGSSRSCSARRLASTSCGRWMCSTVRPVALGGCSGLARCARTGVPPCRALAPRCTVLMPGTAPLPMLSAEGVALLDLAGPKWTLVSRWQLVRWCRGHKARATRHPALASWCPAALGPFNCKPHPLGCPACPRFT